MKPVEIELLERLEILFLGRVNELLYDEEARLAPFRDFSGVGLASHDKIRAGLNIDECEQTEKERLLKMCAWTITIDFKVRDDGERKRFYYGTALEQALFEDRTLGGLAASISLIKTKYSRLGIDSYEIIMTLRASAQQLYLDSGVV